MNDVIIIVENLGKKYLLRHQRQERYTLIDAALSLATFPERGRFVPEFNDGKTRELIYGAYRIVYRVDLAKKAVALSRYANRPI